MVSVSVHLKKKKVVLTFCVFVVNVLVLTERELDFYWENYAYGVVLNFRFNIVTDIDLCVFYFCP